jgi:hypothetical protein
MAKGPRLNDDDRALLKKVASLLRDTGAILEQAADSPGTNGMYVSYALRLDELAERQAARPVR